uniref:Uncharacterized protein n=1 Tax=Physcomitrium patens TaxID=3218 RepID=A0A2K1JIH6_PHYPA|nr:hypothetical protein PHYPA_018763 [Physcomitrium patens]
MAIPLGVVKTSTVIVKLDSQIIDFHPMIPALADVNFDSWTASM